MAKPHLEVVGPTTVNRTVPSRRRKNSEVRTREHLTLDEVERVIEAAKDNRYGPRDALMILLTFRHGLRVGALHRGLKGALTDAIWSPARAAFRVAGRQDDNSGSVLQNPRKLKSGAKSLNRDMHRSGRDFNLPHCDRAGLS